MELNEYMDYIVGIFGGPTPELDALLFVMVVDIISGFLKCAYHKSEKTESGKFSSKEFRKGLIQKVGVLLVVAVSGVISKVMGLEAIQPTIIIAFVLEESLSVLENLALIGVPMPQKLKNLLDVLEETYKEPPKKQ